MKMKLILFCSEGEPFDRAPDLRAAKDRMIELYKHQFDSIVVYTPSLLRSMGLGYFCKEYGDAGVIFGNSPQKHLGFSAWKPVICKLELEKSEKDDIVVYHDANCIKYRLYQDFQDFRGSVLKLITESGFDIYCAREHKPLWTCCKKNVIMEFGCNHPDTYLFNQFCANFLAFRNTPVAMEFLDEWTAACSVERWIDGTIYEQQEADFIHHCPEQGILNNLLANWIRIGKHGIPSNFPRVNTIGRDINLFHYRS